MFTNSSYLHNTVVTFNKYSDTIAYGSEYHIHTRHFTANAAIKTIIGTGKARRSNTIIATQAQDSPVISCQRLKSHKHSSANNCK